MKGMVVIIFILLLFSIPVFGDGLGGVDLWGSAGRILDNDIYGSGSAWATDKDGTSHVVWKDTGGRLWYRAFDQKSLKANIYPGMWSVYAATNAAKLQVVPDQSGGAYVLWENLDRVQYIHRLNGATGPIWNSFLQGPQVYPGTLRGAVDGTGGCLVGWMDGKGSSYVQRFTTNGKAMWGYGVRIPSPIGFTLDYWTSAFRVMSDESGGALVSVPVSLPDRMTAIQVARVLADGTLMWITKAARIGMNATGTVSLAQQASDGQGGCYVAWLQVLQDAVSGSSWVIKMQHVGADGSLLWGDGIVVVRFDPQNTARVMQLVPDGLGGAVLAWIPVGKTANFDSKLTYVHRVNAAGESVWHDWVVLSTTGANPSPSCWLVSDEAGGAFVGRFDSGYASFQHLGANGDKLWGPVGVSFGAIEKYGFGSAVLALGLGSRGALNLIKMGPALYTHSLVDYWTFKADAPVAASAAVWMEYALFGCDDGRLYAVKANTVANNPKAGRLLGELAWRYPETSSTPLAPIRSTPTVYGSTLFCTDVDGWVYRFSLTPTGLSLSWKVRPHPMPVRASGRTSSPAVSSGGIYVTINAPEGAVLYKLDIYGKPVAMVPAGRYGGASPILYDNRVIFACPDDPTGSLKIARSDDLTILAAYPGPPEEIMGTPAVNIPMKQVYAADRLGALYAMDMVENKELPDWPMEGYRFLPGPVESSPWTGVLRNPDYSYSNSLFFTTTNGYLCGINPATGLPMRGYPFKPTERASFYGGPVANMTMPNNRPTTARVYAAGKEGSIFAFDAQNPASYLHTRVPGTFRTSPTLAPSYVSAVSSDLSSIIFTSEDGTLYGFGVR